MNLNLDFISEKFGDGKVAELNLSPKMGTMVKNIQKPLAFIQKIVMAIILLASGFFKVPDLVFEFRMESFKKVNEGLSSLENFTTELTK